MSHPGPSAAPDRDQRDGQAVENRLAQAVREALVGHVDGARRTAASGDGTALQTD